MNNVREPDQVIATLQERIRYNPWAFEPLVCLSQKLLHKGDYDAAKIATEKALELQMQWGTAWDKRLSFQAWVAWTHVMHQRAVNREPWPTSSWDVINFGLVQ